MEESRFFIEEKIPPLTPKLEQQPDVSVISGAPIKLAQKYTLPIKPFKEKTYRLRLEYPLTQHQVDYEIKVQGIAFSEEIVELSFHKDQYYVNGSSPTKVVDELDIAISNILYPVHLNINYKTQTVKVTNQNEIEKRWHENKPYLRKDYQGEFFERYIKQIDTLLKTPYNFTQKLIQKDLFFSLFIHSVYTNYTQTLKIPINWSFYITEEKHKKNFIGEQWIEPVYNHLNGFFVYLQAQTPDGKYQLKAEYNLDPENYTYKDIVAILYKTENEEKQPFIRCKIHSLREKDPLKYKLTKKEIQQKQRKEEEEEINYQKYLRSKKNWLDRLLGF